MCGRYFITKAQKKGVAHTDPFFELSGWSFLTGQEVVIRVTRFESE